MPVFSLSNELVFPPVELATKEGILAIGGDLSEERLILAYSTGIFPWFNEGDPVIWWSPDPRFVLFPKELKISKSMKKIIRNREFDITFDTAFETVITESRKSPRKGQSGTWITNEMIDAYIKLNKIGLAHSVEAWKNGNLAGGLYGVSIGSCFFGESMFSKESNASKAAFITLVEILEKLNFSIIDCQVYTNHLKSLGARLISRKKFIDILKTSIRKQTVAGSWTELYNRNDSNI